MDVGQWDMEQTWSGGLILLEWVIDGNMQNPIKT